MSLGAIQKVVDRVTQAITPQYTAIATQARQCWHVGFGFDHGVGHPLLLLCDAKAPKCLKDKAFKDLDYYSEWPKVADAVIKASASLPILARFASLLPL
jgi:hypothetical protein